MKSYTVYVNFRGRAEYNIEAENEEDIPQIIYDGLITNQYGIDDVKISNYDWSQQFDDQIAQTMKIAQEAKQQEQQLKKVEIEAQQAVKKAEANKEAERLNAEAMELKGKGVKAYNDAITSNQRNMELEIELKKLEIEKIKAEKWNGQYVPINNYGPIPVSYSSKLLGQ